SQEAVSAAAATSPSSVAPVLVVANVSVSMVAPVLAVVVLSPAAALPVAFPVLLADAFVFAVDLWLQRIDPAACPRFFSVSCRQRRGRDHGSGCSPRRLLSFLRNEAVFAMASQSRRLLRWARGRGVTGRAYRHGTLRHRPGLRVRLCLIRSLGLEDG
ncbi:unnamed protein product, partial [Ectocarpus sp. 8 AP-2014]